MSDPKLVNYTTADFATKSDMEIALYKWKEVRDQVMLKLKAKGLTRFTILRIWNKEGVFRIGYLFEYRDESAYKDCQEIWQQQENRTQENAPAKIFANRGIVLEDNY